MIGIYKITSPSKRIYIGQSVNIKKRLYQYKFNLAHEQPKLNNSFLKYGVKNHKFEVVTECDILELNKLEIYYIDLFNAVHQRFGLNCKGGGSNGKHSDETKLKMAKKATGRFVSQATREKMRKRMIGNQYTKGFVFSKERCEKISKINKGRKHTPQAVANMKASQQNRNPMSDETKLKLSLAHMGKKTDLKVRLKMSDDRKGKKLKTSIKNLENWQAISKIIFNTETGIFYFGSYEAAKSILIPNKRLDCVRSTLQGRLKSKNNNSQFIYA